MAFHVHNIDMSWCAVCTGPAPGVTHSRGITDPSHEPAPDHPMPTGTITPIPVILRNPNIAASAPAGTQNSSADAAPVTGAGDVAAEGIVAAEHGPSKASALNLNALIQEQLRQSSHSADAMQDCDLLPWHASLHSSDQDDHDVLGCLMDEHLRRGSDDALHQAISMLTGDMAPSSAELAMLFPGLGAPQPDAAQGLEGHGSEKTSGSGLVGSRCVTERANLLPFLDLSSGQAFFEVTPTDSNMIEADSPASHPLRSWGEWQQWEQGQPQKMGDAKPMKGSGDLGNMDEAMEMEQGPGCMPSGAQKPKMPQLPIAKLVRTSSGITDTSLGSGDLASSALHSPRVKRRASQVEDDADGSGSGAFAGAFAGAGSTGHTVSGGTSTIASPSGARQSTRIAARSQAPGQGADVPGSGPATASRSTSSQVRQVAMGGQESSPKPSRRRMVVQAPGGSSEMPKNDTAAALNFSWLHNLRLLQQQQQQPTAVGQQANGKDAALAGHDLARSNR